MNNTTLLRNFILLIITNALLVIGISSPEAADGEEEQDTFRTVTHRRRFKQTSESAASYLPPIKIDSPTKSIRECQTRAKLFTSLHSLKTYESAEAFIEEPANLYHTSDLINLANHYRHIPQEEPISLAAKIFRNIIDSKDKNVTNRHKSLSYLGLAKIKGRAEDYEKAINFALLAKKYESTKEIDDFLDIMSKRASSADTVTVTVIFTPKGKRKREPF